MNAPASTAAGALDVGYKRLRSYLAVMLVLLIVWQAAISLFSIPAYLMPAPAAAAAAIDEHAREIGAAAQFTIACTLAGMAISAALAVFVATLFVAMPALAAALMPLALIVRTIPMIAVAPLIILIFGRGAGASIGIVALLTYFQIMLAAWKGFQSPSVNTLELMRSYGATFWQTHLKVRAPFAASHIFTGLRIAAGAAVLCAMFAEWLSGAPGLGALILDSYSVQKFDLMWAAVLISAFAAYAFLTLTMMLERMVLNWSR
jgi:ABC-type nitrate/sulfonate/bicarbonate transport system permease component